MTEISVMTNGATACNMWNIFTYVLVIIPKVAYAIIVYNDKNIALCIV